jgi:hypothetical protein
LTTELAIAIALVGIVLDIVHFGMVKTKVATIPVSTSPAY